MVPNTSSLSSNVNKNTQKDFRKCSINSFNIMYANVDSLTNKINEVETYSKLYKADFILLTETMSKNPSSKFDNIFNLKGYNCIENNSGRGVCIFYRNTFTVNIHDFINKMFEPSLFISIKTKNNPINIGLIYRSPSSDDNENNKLNNQIIFATKKLKNLIIFGDFNHPSIDWDCNYTKKGENHCDSKFLFEVLKINTNQLITSPTHHKPNCKPSLIDLILTKNPDIISNIKHNPPIGKSFHDTLTATIFFNTNFSRQERVPRTKITKPNFEKADFAGINNFFDGINWNESLKDKNVNEAWEFIKENIKKAQNLFVPNKIINVNKVRPNHISHDDTLHFLLKNKRQLFKLYKKNRNKTNMYNYNLARNKVSMKIRLLNKEKETKIAKNIKQNPKAFYQFISSKLLKKDGVADLVDEKGVFTKNDTEKCEVINQFFSSVFTKEDLNDVPEFVFEGNIPNTLTTCDINIEDVEKALFNLNPNKSPGPDNFHPTFLKQSSKSLSLPFYLLFNLTLHEGRLPDDFKIAEVRPIYKKGDKSHAGNYRPVSLTSIVCKVFESFIKKTLYDHFINNNLLSNHQFGFVSGRSTVTQLLVTLNDWLYNMDNDIPTDAAYMDFRKAFDTVPHQRLLNKLKGYNINGPILNWISAFLSDRYQYVKINNSQSSMLKVTSGVPQGSVLGPTLFIYFINDLPNMSTNSHMKIFADDTKVYNEIRNIDDVKCLQNSIDEMFEWTQKWLLKFNKDKCKIIHIGKNNKKHDYFIGTGEHRIRLEESDLEKDLGVFIDPDLNFKKHIKNTVKKASYAAYRILKNFTYKNANILVPLFKSLVRPILEYGNVVWSNGIKKYMNKIENVQRKFTKHVKGLQNLSYEERLKKLQLPSLEYRQTRGDMLQVFKIARNYYDKNSTESIFDFNSSSRLRGHNFKINKPRINKTKFQRFFSNRVINKWNDLPCDIVNAKSLNEFKNKFDKYHKDIHYSVDMNYFN